MPFYPRCPDCDCDMQLINGMWRCPWTTSRHGRPGVIEIVGVAGFVAAVRVAARLCNRPYGRVKTHLIFERSVGR
jgi:hypothetical protein